MQVVSEHRLVFKLNNSVIGSFPVTVQSTLKGFVKLLPPEVMLLLVSTIMALLLVWYTRGWLVIDPTTEDFADPDFVAS